MPLPPTAVRARARYAAALYRSALLREPDPQRAGRAVVAAFRALQWADVALDDQLEALLLSKFPPLGRFNLHRAPRLGSLPATFWQLTPAARLALGLRLLRGMHTSMIAQALSLPLPAVQGLLIGGLQTLTGDREPLPEACRRCRVARLDDPAAERAHVLACPTCPAALAQWERTEATLAEQLGHAVGSLPLPHTVDEALDRALDTTRVTSQSRLWLRPAFWQGSMVAVILLGLLGLFWPRGTTRLLPTTVASQTPAAIIAAARDHYTDVPATTGILHRHWQITVRPDLNFAADEWVDAAQPGHHRMQLMTNNTPAEWQAGDGQAHLLYMSTLAKWFCGPLPVGLDTHDNERDNWPMNPTEQAAMRQARWQHGAWAVGLHYLELAATATTIRSLGITGQVPDSTLTLAAEGQTISGTLLLRFDTANHTLREVHELRSNNGQTEDHLPWRLTSTETLGEQSSYVLTSYPAADLPPLVERTTPVVDASCPLVGPEHMQSLPRLLTASGMGALIGLPQLPAGIDHAMIVGPGDPHVYPTTTGFFQPLDHTMQVIYAGPVKRLTFLPAVPPIPTDHLIRAGPWLVHFFPQDVPTLLTAVFQRADLPPVQTLESLNRGNVALVNAEGWTPAELLAVLSLARPLRFEDWVNAPDHFFEPVPIPATVQEHVLRIFNALHTHQAQTQHQVKLVTTRQAPFLNELHDPYHVPAERWPAVRREESWIEYDAASTEQRWRYITSDLDGHVLYARWYDGQSIYSYDALSNQLLSQPYYQGWTTSAPPLQPLLDVFEARWQTLANGMFVAEQPQPLFQSFATSGNEGTPPGSLDSWAADLIDPLAIARKTFTADGNLLRQELLASGGLTIGLPGSDISLPITTIPISITINSSLVEHNEWLAQVPASTFTWTPPSGTRAITQNELQAISRQGDTSEIYTSVARLASVVPFPLWGWQPASSPPAPDFSTAEFRLPNDGHAQAALQLGINNALALGLAARLNYSLGGRPIEVLEGPSAVLRPLLQQTAPAWTSAAPRTVSISGQARNVWTMRTKVEGNNERRWLVLELDNTLVYMHGELPAAQFEQLLQQLGTFQRIMPPSAP